MTVTVPDYINHGFCHTHYVCHILFIIFHMITFRHRQYSAMYLFLYNEKFGWPTAILFLAPAEGWKGPLGPAGNLWPHLK